MTKYNVGTKKNSWCNKISPRVFLNSLNFDQKENPVSLMCYFTKGYENIYLPEPSFMTVLFPLTLILFSIEAVTGLEFIIILILYLSLKVNSCKKKSGLKRSLNGLK